MKKILFLVLVALFVFSSSAVFAFTSFVDFIENEAAETATVGANVAVSQNVSATTITVAELGQATFALPFLPLINEAGVTPPLVFMVSCCLMALTLRRTRAT